MPPRSSIEPCFEEVLQEVAERILSGPNIQEWQNFMEENDKCFIKCAQNDGEFSHETRDTHQLFVELVEAHLEGALEGIGFSSAEFMNMCAEADSVNPRSSAVQAFLELILGCTDFLVFGDIMSDANKRSYYFQMIRMWRQSLNMSHK